jgi:hypothetical protein
MSDDFLAFFLIEYSAPLSAFSSSSVLTCLDVTSVMRVDPLAKSAYIMNSRASTALHIRH